MQLVEPQLRRWTKDEYHRMADLGWFQGQRTELIEGEIVVLSPQKFPHSATTDRAAEMLRGVFGATAWVRMQLPLDLGPFSEPEPDLSVVSGGRADYTDHPTTALLIVEVSDTSLEYDRRKKASLYARIGIADYWILNLLDRQLEIYRHPVPDSSQPYGFRYSDVTILRSQELVTPIARPQTKIRVADLFHETRP